MISRIFVYLFLFPCHYLCCEWWIWREIDVPMVSNTSWSFHLTFCRVIQHITLVFQNPRNNFSGGVWTPYRPSQETFRGPNTYSQDIFGRLGLYQKKSWLNHRISSTSQVSEIQKFAEQADPHIWSLPPFSFTSFSLPKHGDDLVSMISPPSPVLAPKTIDHSLFGLGLAGVPLLPSISLSTLGSPNRSQLDPWWKHHHILVAGRIAIK